MTNANERDGARRVPRAWPKFTSIIRVRTAFARPPADVPVAFHAAHRHFGRRSRRTARHAVRAGPRGHLGPGPRRAAREDPAAHLAADALQGVLRLAARREAARSEHCLRRRLPGRSEAVTSACASARASSAPPSPRAGRCSSTTCRRTTRYVGNIEGVRSQLVVPLRRKKRVIGALNLYGEQVGQFTPRDEAMLRQFGAHVAVAIENARLFERERGYSATLETLAEIAREVASILDLEQLLERVATLVHKRGRVPHVRHLPAEPAVGRARDEARDPLRQPRRLTAAARRPGARRLRRRAQDRRQRAGRHSRSALSSRGSKTAARSWRSRC